MIGISCLASVVMSQNVGITSSGSSFTPDASSVLELKSTISGLLIPRMTMAQRNLINSGSFATGLMIYQTDNTPGFYYYTGAAWVPFLSSTSGWGLTGNAGTTAGTNYLGTTDAKDLVLKANAIEKLRLVSGGSVKINGAYTLPASDGTANQVLNTNGAGVVSWGTATSGGTGVMIETVTYGSEGNSIAMSNANYYISFYPQVNMTVSKFYINVFTQSSATTMDFAIYNSAGTKIGTIPSAFSAPGIGLQTVTLTSPITFTAMNKYWIGVAGSIAGDTQLVGDFNCTNRAWINMFQNSPSNAATLPSITSSANRIWVRFIGD